MDNAYTAVVAPGGVAVVVAAVDGAVAGGVVGDGADLGVGDVEGVVVTHKVPVGSSGHIQGQAADNGTLLGSGPAVMLSLPDSDGSERERVGKVGYPVHCSRFAGDRHAEQALEEEGRCSDVHTNYTPEG